MTGITLREAMTDGEIAACFPVLRALRPHLPDAPGLVAQLARQRAQGYRLLAAWRGPEAVGAAGWRLTENLIHGRFAYVDDLVVVATERRSGLGARLLAAVADQAREAGCRRMTLDTGMDNAFAQRFYFRFGMLARGLHFGIDLA